MGRLRLPRQAAHSRFLRSEADTLSNVTVAAIVSKSWTPTGLSWTWLSCYLDRLRGSAQVGNHTRRALSRAEHSRSRFPNPRHRPCLDPTLMLYPYSRPARAEKPVWSQGQDARTADWAARRLPGRLFGSRMNRKAFVSTLGQRARAGSGSAWMWGGRSTSCILWLDDRLPLHHSNRTIRPGRIVRRASASASRPIMGALQKQPRSDQEPVGDEIRLSGGSFRATRPMFSAMSWARAFNVPSVQPAMWGVMSTLDSS